MSIPLPLPKRVYREEQSRRLTVEDWETLVDRVDALEAKTNLKIEALEKEIAEAKATNSRVKSMVEKL
jgi:hypothetical protein